MEIPSREIGELVMEKLRKLDDVAYVRFASVYRQFRDLTEVKREIDQLLASRASSSGSPQALAEVRARIEAAARRPAKRPGG